ncbi:MAG: hypothetical protein WCJ26_12900, partial [bacterium]
MNLSAQTIGISGKTTICLGESTTLKATMAGSGYGTTNYIFEIIDYTTHPPFSGGTAIDANFTECNQPHDDCFAPANGPSPPDGYPIGFTFCFFNLQYDRFWVGSNGWIGFTNPTGHGWTTFTATPLPNSDSSIPKNCIFAPWQDWWPGWNDGPNAVFYYTTGTAPDRKLVVYWSNCPLYLCPSDPTNRGTFMIVLNEQSSIIENFIQKKPQCPSSNEGSTQGVHNADGTIAFTALNRNFNVWSAQTEGTRFNPSGVNWYKDAYPGGTYIGYGADIIVSPLVTTTYYAVVGTCDGSMAIGSATVTVNPLTTPTFISGPANACQNDVKTYTTENTGINYTWTFTGGLLINGGGINDNFISLKWTNFGVNSVSVNYQNSFGCQAVIPTTMNVTVDPFETPVITTSADEFCPEANVSFTTQAGKSGYIWSYLPSGAVLVSGGTSTDNSCVLKWSSPGLKTITVNYTDPGGCTGDPPTSKSITIKPVPAVSGPFSKGICTGANTAVTLASVPAGADFSWVSPSPTCSANILACPPGLATGSSINDVLTLSDMNSGTVTYHITPALNSCTGTPQDFLVTVTPLPLPTITDNSGNPHQACMNATISYTTEDLMSAYTWLVSPGGTIIGGSGTKTVQVTWNTTGAQWVSVNYSNANGCSAAVPPTYAVTVHPLPVPAIAGPAAVCINTTGIYSTTAGMANYQWSVSAGGTITGGTGSNSVDVAWTGSGTQQVLLNYTDINGCTAASPSAFPVTVNTRPVPTIAGPGAVCINTGTTYSTEAGMTGYTWNISAGGTILSGAGTNSVSVSWSTSVLHTIDVNYTNANSCVAATATSLPVTVNPRPAPVVSGPGSACISSTATYSTAPGMTGYTWNISAGGTITAGSATNSIDVSWNTAGGQSVSLNYTDANGCSAPSPTAFPVTVNPRPAPVATGPSSVCTNSNATYSTAAGMTNYLWSVPAGGTIISGSGTSTINVLWNTSGNHAVVLNYTDANLCDASVATNYPVTVHLRPIPAIAGPPSICINTSGTYSTETGMTGYTWTLAAGGTITAGAGTSAVTVLWNNAGTHPLNVSYTDVNGCSAAAPAVYNVTVNPRPVPVVSGPASICVNTTGTYSTESGMSGYSWSVSAGGTIISGATTNSIGILWSSTGTKTITVNYTDANGCTAPVPTGFTVNVNTLPVPTITGPNSMCTGIPATYTTETGMQSYIWPVSSGGTITAGGTATSPTATVTWNTAGPNSVSVNYVVGTGCTAANPSNYPVMVNPSATPSVSSPVNPVCLTASTTYTTQPGMTGYTWTVSSGGTITSSSNTNVITVKWDSPGAQFVTVNYTNSFGCQSTGPVQYDLIVNPLPLTTISEGTGAVCESMPHVYMVPNDPACTFTWSVIPAGRGIISG